LVIDDVLLMVDQATDAGKARDGCLIVLQVTRSLQEVKISLAVVMSD